MMSHDELQKMQREGRAKAAEQNTGEPCDVCGSKQPRMSIQRLPGGGVYVGISYSIPADAARAELAGLRALLKSFEESSIAAPATPKRKPKAPRAKR